jgi:hypothetical protein
MKNWVLKSGVNLIYLTLLFDFISLINHNVLQDSVGDLPVTIFLEKDSITFHAWDSRIDTLTLIFECNEDSETLIDLETGSNWDRRGTCISGLLEGNKLKPVQAYEEYWHSWRTFHPESKKVEAD